MSSFSRPDRYGTPAFIRTTHLGISKSDLERDSGFSDASSEYLSTVDLTDSEGAGRTGSVFSQSSTGQPMAVMGGSYAGLSPMIIMNHFVPNQQPLMTQGEKHWSFPSSLELMPQPQMVLLQPMVQNGGSSPKTCPDNVRQSKGHVKHAPTAKHAPTVKSYARIAPQPADVPSKRSGSSRLKTCSRSGYEQRQKKRHHSRRPYCPAGSQLPPQPPVSAVSIVEPPLHQAHGQELLDETSLYLLTGGASLQSPLPDYRMELVDTDVIHADQYQDGPPMDKQQRFSNTYNILDKSGLLGITMRTKQLIKENKRTQVQLQQLQQQTSLLLEAVGSADPQIWTRLQLSLQDMDRDQMGSKALMLVA